MGNVFTAKARKHGNALAAALFPDNMPESVYRMLVAQANAGLPTLHRYFRLRKQLLGIKDELHYYDVYPTMFPGRNIPKFTIAESERLSLEALSPYGAEYLDLLKRGFGGKWTEPYPARAQGLRRLYERLGYDVHPYLLLNHNDDYRSIVYIRA
jgi:oligoendopeptidase F